MAKSDPVATAIPEPVNIVAIESRAFQACMVCSGGEVALSGGVLGCARALKQAMATPCPLPQRIKDLVNSSGQARADLAAQTTPDWIDGNIIKDKE